MTDSPKKSMWAHQSHFRINVQVAAKSLFEKLSPELSPYVFLVGKYEGDDGKWKPLVCVEPAEVPYDISVFNSLDQVYHLLKENDPERKVNVRDPSASQRKQRSLENKWLRDAFLHILHQFDEGGTFWASKPVCVGEYKISVVLRINSERYESFHKLKSDKVHNRYQINVSLIDAAVDELLILAADALTRPTPGSTLGVIGKDREEIVRVAGRKLMYGPAWKAGNFEGLHWLYDSCNNISVVAYEGEEARGQMFICAYDHPNLEVLVKFTRPVPMRKHRSIRKLLEMSHNDLALLCDSAFVYGMGRIKGRYHTNREDLFKITFSRHYYWSLVHGNDVMMHVRDGTPILPKKKVSGQKLLYDLAKIFPENSHEANLHIIDLVEAASDQPHGALLVISKKAADEANRLSSQCTQIESIFLKSDIVADLTSIDGATLLDPKGNCYAVGVILDGLATTKGDPGRGARFNSAVRYVETNKNCLAVVISEDGTIDLVPDLLPRISRQNIDEVLSELDLVASADDIDLAKFNGLIDWLRLNRFYLLEKDCHHVNKVIDHVDSLFQEMGETRIIHSKFRSDEKMDESYYL